MMNDIIEELKRVAYVMFKDGWQSNSTASRAGLEIIHLRGKLSKAKQDIEFERQRNADLIEEVRKEARREALEEAAKLIEEGFDRGFHRKQDTCAHGKYEWEDCETCAAAAIRALAAREEE